jgi:colanic acid biosynthesis glycosyl transferase WcaI
MRILLYSISYSPEVAGSGRFNGELTQWLANKGHHVDVITAYPYYPEWQVRREYKGRGWFVEKSGNLTVYRTPLYVPSQVTGKTRILHELSFAANSLIHWFKLISKKYDVIIGVCPPLQMGLFPLLFSRIKKSHFVFHVQDLQVDAARQLGMVKNKQLLNILEKIERFLLQNADYVSSISDGMKRNIIRKGVNENKFFMLENWVDVNLVRPLPVEKSLKISLGFSTSDKIALYAGNIGEKQGLEFLVAAAELLADQPDIKIVIIGDGAALSRLKKASFERQLANLLFFPFFPYEQMSEMLAIADVHLIIQKRATSDLVMPSKLVSILSAGGVAILSADLGTSLSDILIENKLGWVVEPENAIALAKGIKTAIDYPDISAYRLNARSYAEKHFDRTAILTRFEDFLLAIKAKG